MQEEVQNLRFPTNYLVAMNGTRYVDYPSISVKTSHLSTFVCFFGQKRMTDKREKKTVQRQKRRERKHHLDGKERNKNYDITKTNLKS